MENSSKTIKKMPVNMRPRERLLNEGPRALNDMELLAIILRTGTVSSDVLDLAVNILHHFGSLNVMAQASREELLAIDGIGQAKAALLLAAVEIGRRCNIKEIIGRKIVNSSDAADYLMNDMIGLDREYFKVMLLDTHKIVIGVETISIGTLNASLVHPRELFKSAIRRSAAAVIIAHNHPSGQTDPSGEDIALTRRVIQSGELLGIEVLDHIIIGNHSFRSLRADGLF